MLGKIKRLSRQTIAFVLSLLTVLSIVAVPSTSVCAADGTLYFNSGDTISYGSFFTRRMTFDGSNTAYCLEPIKNAPDAGSYQYNLLPEDSPIRKALYYLNGGYGYEKITKNQCFSGWSDTDAYVVGHLTLSYIYDNYSAGGDAFMGAPSNFINKVMEVVNVINGLPAPPKSFQAFILPGNSRQTLAGSWYKIPYGWIEIQKSTANNSISDGNANYSLEGAKYGIYRDNTQISTLTTDKNGYAKSGQLEEGSYVVRELQAGDGYAVDTKEYNVTVQSDATSSLKVKEVPQNNPMELLLQKIDAETKEAKAQGAASLGHAEFTVKFYQEQMDTDPAGAGKQPAKTWVFQTDQDGMVHFTKDYLVSGDEFYYQMDGKTPCLPLGTVTVQETKAPEGYLVNKEIQVQKITGDRKQETVSCYQTSSVPESPYRGDLEFVKVSDGELQRLADVPFAITSKTTGESHVIMTDKNGYASTASSWAKHTVNTNKGKSSDDGIWFGKSKPDDKKGALLYDTYIVEEQQCKANENKNLLKFEVTVYKDSVTVQLGTLTNDSIELFSTALDKETGSHLAKPGESVTLIDTVEYEGLKKGKEYKIVGTLMDKETGKPILIDGKEVKSENTFKAKKADGKTEVSFTFNGISLAGRTVVIFEELYQEDLKLAVHADIEDEDQTIYFPEIGTTAKDLDTEANISNTDAEVALIDTVSYRNLIPGMEYEMTGILMDKGTGQPIEDEGEAVTAKAAFVPEKESGKVDVAFEFNGSALKGKTIVAFESMAYEGKELAVHEDLDYEGQTIYFPEIGTTAIDSETGCHTAKADEEVTIIDTVKYKNLIPGKEYKVSGILMDKESEEELFVNGEKVTAEEVFVPEKSKGTIEMVFTFDGSALKGKEIVVFETVAYQEKEVASHRDIEDDKQTIYFPEIHTTAKDGNDGDKELTSGDSLIIVDTIEYRHLESGQEYRIAGTLMDKTTGGMLEMDGKPVVSETVFTAEKTDGAEEVVFTFNGSVLANHELVVFEKMYLVGEESETEITAHEDLEDEGQTVKIVEKETPRPKTPRTGDDTNAGLWILVMTGSIVGVAVLAAYARKKKNVQDK